MNLVLLEGNKCALAVIPRRMICGTSLDGADFFFFFLGCSVVMYINKSINKASRRNCFNNHFMKNTTLYNTCLFMKHSYLGSGTDQKADLIPFEVICEQSQCHVPGFS